MKGAYTLCSCVGNHRGEDIKEDERKKVPTSRQTRDKLETFEIFSLILLHEYTLIKYEHLRMLFTFFTGFRVNVCWHVKFLFLSVRVTRKEAETPLSWQRFSIPRAVAVPTSAPIRSLTGMASTPVRHFRDTISRNADNLVSWMCLLHSQLLLNIYCILFFGKGKKNYCNVSLHYLSPQGRGAVHLWSSENNFASLFSPTHHVEPAPQAWQQVLLSVSLLLHNYQDWKHSVDGNK